MAPRNRKPKPAVPYAIGLFYEPSIAAAYASGVPLPQSRVNIPINYDQAVQAGVVLPLSHIHVDPTAAAPDAPAPLYTDPPLHKYIRLPATMFASTSAIHPQNFDIAEAFVRLQDFDPATMVIPEPAPGMSTAAVLYGAGVIKPGQPLDKLHSIKVRRTSELKSVLKREGPILVEVLELEQLQEAPEVFELLKEKKEEGWACWPSLKVLSELSCIATKIEEVEFTLLPKLRKQLRKKKRGNMVIRRMRAIKENLKKVRRRVKGDVITPGICEKIGRAILRARGKKPRKKPSYLLKKIDEWAPILASDLTRPIVFLK